MKHKRAVSPLIVVTLVGMCALQGTLAAQQAGGGLGGGNAEQEARKLRREPGKPIDTQLQPADKEVEVLDFDTSPGLAVRDEFGRILESNVKAFDLVALVRVTDIASDLTADRSFVKSTIEAEILEVLKSDAAAPRQYAKGDRLTFPREGGTVRIDQKTVRARVSWARNLDRGQTYLVFGWHPRGELAIPLEAVYQVVGPRLRSVSTGKSGRDDIEKDTLNGVRDRVRRAIGAK